MRLFIKINLAFRRESLLNMQFLTCHITVSVLETKDKACSIFLDFPKVFDTMNHNILLSKSEYHGVHGLPLKLMKFYFSDRTQYVKIGGSMYLSILL